jgi:hypothetical protein
LWPSLSSPPSSVSSPGPAGPPSLFSASPSTYRRVNGCAQKILQKTFPYMLKKHERIKKKNIIASHVAGIRRNFVPHPGPDMRNDKHTRN